MAAPAVIPELAPPPAPARPRVLVTGTALASAAAWMVLVGMVALYVAQRSATVGAGEAWLPDEVSMPLLPATTSLMTLLMSAVTMQWAVYSISNSDRIRTYLAFGVTLLLGVAYINAMGFYFTEIGAAAATEFGVLFYGITATHLAMTAAGLIFLLLMGFRTLGGQYSATDREGVTAAALFWYATVAAYAVIWYAVFVMK